MPNSSVSDSVLATTKDTLSNANKNLQWIEKEMSPYFLGLNKDEIEAITLLTLSLNALATLKKITLADRDERLIIAQVGSDGSIYDAVHDLRQQPVSYAEITTSFSPLPDSDQLLEVLRFDFATPRSPDEKLLPDSQAVDSGAEIKKHVQSSAPEFTSDRIDSAIATLSKSNPEYVRKSSPERVARVVRSYIETQNHGGIYLGLESTDYGESRISFGVTNPPHAGFLQQILEVFKRLRISLKRAYQLSVQSAMTPYFLANFYVTTKDNQEITRDSELFHTLRSELYSTQIASTTASSYNTLIKSGLMSGPDTTLISAMVGFCHTNLAHNAQEIFDQENVALAFHHNLGLSAQLVDLFYARFKPDIENRNDQYKEKLAEVTRQIEMFNTGRQVLDSLRRVIYQTALAFIKNTLKTNFFVIEKHALSFRLDPQYLEDLDAVYTEDLPTDRPFRITFFYGRRGCGYHIGFSDIARGGWRTIITQNSDDYSNNAATIFKENYVLAHTQHLKNKDIYEGGSKMVAILTIDPRTNPQQRDQYLYKLQHAFANAFLDLFVTDNQGRAKDSNVVDYYGQEEPIELGPDENMHNEMIERIARLAERREYVLGKGIMSSKVIGINHKEFGVTSIGVIRFAEVIMKSIGIDMHSDVFTVKFTGGPNGDVAGNGIRLLLERCPGVKISLIVDGTGAIYDPDGLNRAALEKIVLSQDVEGFDHTKLNKGGFILYRMQTRKESITEMYKKVEMTTDGLLETWISTDEFNNTFNALIFTTKTDLFIPAGGRPETINHTNVSRYFDTNDTPASRVIVEGANSFITPQAREVLQDQGVVIMRDASANKCGVISSSYEIIANLLFSDEEFLENKTEYVSDVVDILNKMAEVEAKAVIHKHSALSGSMSYTEVSAALSNEINRHYARMFHYFESNPEQIDLPSHKSALLSHMPKIIRDTPRFSARTATHLPNKVKYAILASKLASGMVYEGNDDNLYADIIEAQLRRAA